MSYVSLGGQVAPRPLQGGVHSDQASPRDVGNGNGNCNQCT